MSKKTDKKSKKYRAVISTVEAKDERYLNGLEHSSESECYKHMTSNSSGDQDSEQSVMSFEIDYQIQKMDENDIDQVIMLNKHTSIFEDIYNTSLEIIDKCIAAKSGDYILCYLGLLQINMIKKYMPKRAKKLLKEYNDYDLLIYNKISNVPLEITVDLFSNLEVNHEVVFISKCKLLQKDELISVAEDFPEYGLTDIEYFPVNSEEVFFVDNNCYSCVFCCNDVFYKLFVINEKNIQRFKELCKNELNGLKHVKK